MTRPIDLHEWVSFEDRDEHRTWVFDVTFLRSNYMCIYGCGCQGIAAERAPELLRGCCSYGAHFVDDDDIAKVEANAERLTDANWQFRSKARKKSVLTKGDPEDDGSRPTVTRVVDGACIFLNRPGFEGGVGCALHIAAEQAGERPLDWKPQVCWQVPLRLEHSTDESGHVTSRLREWKRRDWGEGGEEFGWWCTEQPEAFVGAEPLYKSARDDIIELVGVAVYDELVGVLEASTIDDTTWIPLPHPAVRGEPTQTRTES
jgi:hypothetical protein